MQTEKASFKKAYSLRTAGNIASAKVVDVRKIRALRMIELAGNTNAITVYELDVNTGTFVEAADLAFTCTANESIAIPSGIYACRYVKFISGTNDASSVMLVGAS